LQTRLFFLHFYIRPSFITLSDDTASDMLTAKLRFYSAVSQVSFPKFRDACNK